MIHIAPCWLGAGLGGEAGIWSHTALKQNPLCVQLPALMCTGLLSVRLSTAAAEQWDVQLQKPGVCLRQKFNLAIWETFSCVPPGQTVSSLKQKSD